METGISSSLMGHLARVQTVSNKQAVSVTQIHASYHYCIMWNFVLKIHVERQVVSFALTYNSYKLKYSYWQILLISFGDKKNTGCGKQRPVHHNLHCNPALHEAVNKWKCFSTNYCDTKQYIIYGHITIFFHHRAQASSNLPIRHRSFGYEIIVLWVERSWIGYVVHLYWSWLVCLLPFLRCHTSDIHYQEIHETLKEQWNNTH